MSLTPEELQHERGHSLNDHCSTTRMGYAGIRALCVQEQFPPKHHLRVQPHRMLNLPTVINNILEL